jgi:RNA polymerase sigma-70 factor (ECF subfamily)
MGSGAVRRAADGISFPGRRMKPDDEAFSLLLGKYQSYLRVLAGLHIGARLQAKVAPSDIVQKTLLKAYEHRDQYRGSTTAELVGWLRKILANALAEELRRFGRKQRDLALERSLEQALDESSARLEAWLVAEQSSPSQQAVHHEQAARLAQALADLPEEHRTAVELRHLRGYSVEAIAQHMGRSEASVTGLLRRGLKRLRERLDEPL